MALESTSRGAVRRLNRPGFPGGSGRHDVVEEPDLGNPVVGGADPLVRPVLVSEQAQVLVCPGQLKATFVFRHHLLHSRTGHVEPEQDSPRLPHQDSKGSRRCVGHLAHFHPRPTWRGREGTHEECPKYGFRQLAFLGHDVLVDC
jgi:hypothetical protein